MAASAGAEMGTEFKNDDFVAGLTRGVTRIGNKLAEFFPRP